jgi:hypothetical protein
MKYVNGRLTGLVTFWCRNCLLQQVIEGKIKGGIEVTERRGRRRRKLLDDLKGKERILSFEGGSFGSHYVEEALDLS